MPGTDKERPTYTADYIKGDWDKAVYLDNPHVDSLMDALLGLGAEVWAMRQRMMAMERLIEEKGVMSRTALESYQFTAQDKQASDQERDAYLDRVFAVLTRETGPVKGPVPSTRVKPLDHG